MNTLMMNDREALHPAKWTLQLPFRGAKLLLVEASQVLVEQFVKLGWEVELLSTLRSEWEHSRVLWRTQLPENERYHAVILPWEMAYTSDPWGYFAQMQSLLLPGGVLQAYLPNSMYYARLLHKASREMRPWPMDMPLGRSFVLQELQAQNLNLQEQVDAQAAESGFAQWKYVDGIDAKVLLPAHPAAKRLSFTHGWVAQWKAPEGNVFERDLKAFQSALEAGCFEGLEQRLDLLFAQAPDDARLLNFKGILAFYRADAMAAYKNFMLSLEQNPRAYDVWQNALDAALRLGRDMDLLDLYQKRFQEYGLPSELDLDS